MKPISLQGVSLRTRFSVLILLFSLGTTLLLLLLHDWDHQQLLINDRKREFVQRVEHIGAVLSHSLARSEDAALMAAEFAAMEGYTRLMVVDGSGRIVLDGHGKGVGKLVSEEDPAFLSEQTSRLQVSNHLLSEGADSTLDLYLPLPKTRGGGSPILFVRMETHRLFGRVESFHAEEIGFFLVVLLLAVTWFALHLHRWFVLPLEAMSRICWHWREEDWTAVADTNTPGEIGLLASSMNDMVTKLKERNASQFRQQEAMRRLNQELTQQIEEREKTLAALRQSNEFLEILFNISHLSQVILDPNFNFIRVNQTYANACGFPVDFFPGKNHFDLYPHGENEAIFREVVASKTPFSIRAKPFEFPDHPEWGITYWDWSLTPVMGNDNEVSWLIFILLDVTPTRRAELAMERANLLLRSVLDSIPSLVFWKDTDSRYLGCNRPFAQAAGLAHPGQIVGLSDDDLPWATLAPLYRKDDREVMENGVGRIQYEEPFIWSDERQGYLLSTKVPLRSAADEILGILGHSLDITLQKRYQEEKEELERLSLRSARLASLGTLAADITHEINNPNNAILVNAALLSQAWEETLPVLREYYRENGEFSLGGAPFSEMAAQIPLLFRAITENSRRIAATIDNVKHLARERPGQSGQLFSMTELVSRSVSILQNGINKRCSRFRLEATSTPTWVRGMPEQMEQVVINLVMNALQALPERDREVTVRLSALDPQGVVQLSVEDQGQGIAEEHLNRLGEPFFTTRHAEGGMGLGLSISRRILDNHGGSISFRSRVGEGTTVMVTLPLCTPPIPQESAL